MAPLRRCGSRAVKDLSTEPDDCIYLAVKMRKNSDKTHPEFALLQLPINLIGRFLRLPDKDGKSYIMYMDDVIRHCLPLIFCRTQLQRVPGLRI